MATALFPEQYELSIAAVPTAANGVKRGPTKGHLIRSHRIRVKDLDALYAKLKAQGVEFEGPVAQSANVPAP